MTFKNIKKKEPISNFKQDVPLAKKNSKSIWFWSKLGVYLIVFLMALYGGFMFYSTHEFRTPVMFQNPFPSKIIVSPVASPSARTSRIFNVGKIVDYIYMKESSSGKNDSCRNLGLYNGYGFRENSFEWKCFSSHEEVRSLVIDWLTTHIKNGDVEKALCLYNRGINERGCSYAINLPVDIDR